MLYLRLTKKNIAMKHFFFLVSVMISGTLMAQGGMNLGCTDCVLENRWQDNQYFNRNNSALTYALNSSSTFPTSQVWQFEHVTNKPANIFRIRNNGGYVVRTASGVTIQSSPANDEDSQWELLVRDSFYFLLAPCEMRGMHIENLNGNIQYSDMNFGMHSAQWIIKDAHNPNGGSNLRKGVFHPEDSIHSRSIGARTMAGSKGRVMSDLKKGGKAPDLKLSKNLSINMKVNLSKKLKDSSTVYGGVANGNPDFTFQLSEKNGHISGTVINMKQKRAFEIKETESGLISEEVDIDELICIGEPEGSHDGPVTNMMTRGCDIPDNTDVYHLNSLPGAAAVIYLDFDGEYVESIWWNGGVAVDAQPMQLSDGWIYTIWQGIAEDFMPFNVTVTTDEAVYLAAPLGQKTRVIFTTTNFRGSGGVARFNTFNNASDEIPCWVFNDFSPQGIWDTGSHEIGHTLGLSHDGRNNPHEEYYAGHGDWAPIMGWSVDRQMAQWSRGEYQNANNSQDDIAMITRAVNDISFRTDDIPGSKSLDVTVVNSTTKNVSDGGLIENATDTDLFTFSLDGSSELHLDITPASVGPNLNIGVRIFKGSLLIASFNPDGPDNNFSTNLPAGSYILEIDGVGERDPFTTGYSDYASLGTYTISGTIESEETTTTNLLAVYNVPSPSAIPNGFKQYSYVHTLGNSGPNMSSVFNSVFNWWGSQWNTSGLYQFTLETTTGQPRHYTNLTDYSTYSLHQANPEFNINSSTGFPGLDGNYWVTLDGNNLVLVEKSGLYALYFSNSATAPTLPNSSAKKALAMEEEETYELLGHPNPFSQTVSMVIPEEMGNCHVEVADMTGMLVESFDASAGKIILGGDYKPGIYNISISGNNTSKQLKIVKY